MRLWYTKISQSRPRDLEKIDSARATAAGTLCSGSSRFRSACAYAEFLDLGLELYPIEQLAKIGHATVVSLCSLSGAANKYRVRDFSHLRLRDAVPVKFLMFMSNIEQRRFGIFAYT